MAGVTGLQLAARIRADRPHQPFILATGYSETPEPPEDIPILQKPFDQAEMAALVAMTTELKGSAKIVRLRP